MRTPDEPTPAPRPTDAVPSAHVASHHVTALELVWRNVWVRAATYLLLVAGLVTIAWTLRGRYAFVLQVGVIGFVIAYILNPVVEALKRIRIRRVFGVIIVYVALLNLLVLGSLLLGQVVVELSRFVSLIPEAVGTFGTQLGRIGVWFEGIVDRLPAPITLFLDQRLGLTAQEGDLALQAQDRVAGVLEAVVANLLALFENLLSGGPAILVSGATTIVNATLQTFLIVLVSVYFLYDFPRFVESFKRVVPVRWRGVSDDLLEKADRAVGGYLRGQLLITSLLGILIWIGLSIAGVPFATAISFLAAIFNLVPYLGPIVGAVPAILLGFTVGPWTPLFAILVFVVANQLEANVLSPLILSRNVDLHPVTVLLAILAGLGLLGFVGALLAVPVVAMTKVVLEDYLFTRPAYTAPIPPPPEASEGDVAGEAHP